MSFLNVHRKDLSDMEKARLLKAMKDKFGYTQEQLAQIVKKSQSWVSRHLQMLEFESEGIRDIMPRGIKPEQLTEGQARALLSKPEEERREILERAEKKRRTSKCKGDSRLHAL